MTWVGLCCIRCLSFLLAFVWELFALHHEGKSVRCFYVLRLWCHRCVSAGEQLVLYISSDLQQKSTLGIQLTNCDTSVKWKRSLVVCIKSICNDWPCSEGQFEGWLKILIWLICGLKRSFWQNYFMTVICLQVLKRVKYYFNADVGLKVVSVLSRRRRWHFKCPFKKRYFEQMVREAVWSGSDQRSRLQRFLRLWTLRNMF